MSALTPLNVMSHPVSEPIRRNPLALIKVITLIALTFIVFPVLLFLTAIAQMDRNVHQVNLFEGWLNMVQQAIQDLHWDARR